MNVGPWEIIIILLLIGMIVVPLLAIFQVIALRKRITAIEEQIQEPEPIDEDEFF